ncbi:pyridoxamine 5'-phosphate oxidase family protein [Pseudoclavibacter helvolus]
MKEFRFGMLTTIEGSGSLVAHPLTIQEAEFDGELWNPAAEAWFPDGPEDPNVGVLKFTASGGEYWDTPVVASRPSSASSSRRCLASRSRATVARLSCSATSTSSIGPIPAVRGRATFA